MTTDKSFEGQAGKFDANIYGKPKGLLREKVLLQDILEHLPQNEHPLRILDCGGGSGRIAVHLASLGHHVTLNDISNEMLDLAKQHARKFKLEHKICWLEGPFQQLVHQMEQPFDAVLCHAVLEWLADPLEALAILKSLTKENGWLSIMFYNKHALLFHKVIKTHYFDIHKQVPRNRQSLFTPPNPLEPETVIRKIEELGLKLQSTAGIRIFYDYIERLERYSTLPPKLEELELHYKNQFPFSYLGRYFHLTAIR